MQTCGTNEKMNLSKGKWQVVDINSINGVGFPAGLEEGGVDDGLEGLGLSLGFEED